MTAKNELVQMIIDGMSTDADSNETSSKKKDPAEIVVSDDIINALLDEKKGFENSPLLDGEWKLVLSQLPSSTITEDAKGEEESETNEDSSKPSAVRRIVSRIGKSIIKTRRFWKQGLTSKSKTFYGDDLLYKGETPVLKNRGLIKLNVKVRPTSFFVFTCILSSGLLLCFPMATRHGCGCCRWHFLACFVFWPNVTQLYVVSFPCYYFS